MTTVKAVYDFINAIAPFDKQESWDNSGLLVGSFEKEVKSVAVCLDISRETIEKAKDCKADLIVSHHPVIFSPIKNVRGDSVVYALIRNDISAICAHTNWDSAAGGVNDVLAALLGLRNIKPLETSEDDSSAPILRIGELNAPLSPDAFAALVAKQLRTPVRFVKGGRTVKTVVLAGGGGGSLTPEIADGGFDAYVTGDVKHNEFIDAQNKGLTLIAAGHYETENPAMPTLARKIQDHFPALNVVVIDSNPVSFAGIGE